MKWKKGMMVRIGSEHAYKHMYEGIVGSVCIYERYVMQLADGLKAHEVRVSGKSYNMYIVEEDLLPATDITNDDSLFLLQGEELI